MYALMNAPLNGKTLRFFLITVKVPQKSQKNLSNHLLFLMNRFVVSILTEFSKL